MVLYVITQVEEKFICLICQNVFDAQCDQISFCFLAQQHSWKEPKRNKVICNEFYVESGFFFAKVLLYKNDQHLLFNID